MDPEVTAPDLTACEAEPIHLSGAVQPHGALIACDLSSWIVTDASSNAGSFLGFDDDTAILGRPADAILRRDVLHDLRNTLQGAMISGSAERLIDVVPGAGERRADVAIHASGGKAILEITDHAGSDTTSTDPIVLVKSMMGRLKRAPTLARFLQMAASQVRSVTGYDRVMIYKFRPDESGEVVAEALRPGLDPFLGLRYPASDIPAQARALYHRQWLRMIVDVGYDPVPIAAGAGGSLDLSLATLRSVSPVHLEYLRNMGSAATLTVSLIMGDRLWGLIACHHEAPRRIAASTCAATEMFGQILSLQIEAREAAEEQADVARLREAHDRFIAAMPADRMLLEELPRSEAALRQLVACDGLGVWSDGRFTGVGVVPPLSVMPALIDMLDAQESHEPFVTHRLADAFPLAGSFADRVSGLMAVRFLRSTREYLLFFRQEVVRTVVWGGNPTKPVTVQGGTGRIGPRKSFEAWRELVRGEADPWQPAEVQVVKTLRVSLLDVILRRADLLNRERKAAHESQALLIAELNHRVKNMLALIRSLVRQSRNDARSVEAFTADLEHRIRALAFAHDQLTAVGYKGAPLRRLMDAEIEAWAGAAGNRVSLEGPPVTLGSRAYQTLALVFHEMMTNAAKYGALSVPSGHLAIGWRLEAEGPLVVHWQESGGPSVVAPTRRGFGSVVVEQTIPFELGGESRVDYRPGGVEGHFTVPAAHLVRDAAPLEGPAPPDGAATDPIADFSGKRLLLVEDSMMIALDAQGMLNEAGLEVEIAGNVADARRALRVGAFDAAILDVNLSGETSFAVADALTATRVPFVFATGYGESSIIPERFGRTPVVAKPYDERSLRRALSTGMERAAGPA